MMVSQLHVTCLQGFGSYNREFERDEKKKMQNNFFQPTNSPTTKKTK